MRVGTGRTTRPRGPIRPVRGGFAGLAVVALAVAACGPGAVAGTPRPTDPRLILANAVTATAALPSLRLHVELAANVGALMGGPANALMTAALDADVDLATRQVTGRTTTTMPANFDGTGRAAQRQVGDIIVTRDAAFSRDSQTGRWTKSPNGGFNGGPTNAEIATMIATVLANPAMTFDLLEASECTLGTCDHVVVHVDGRALVTALGPLLGAPVDATSMVGSIPNFDVDVRVDQATNLISELRTSIGMAGSTEQILLTVSNPGAPVQIVPPPAALTDDVNNFGGGLGGGGIDFATPFPIGSDESGILEEVGNELESAMPDEPLPSTP